MRVSKRLVILFVLLMTLLGLLLMQNSPLLVLQEYGLFVFLGLTGAIFANSTGAGGGVIFVPIFNQLQLSAEQIVATSFTIQCFGMVAGAIAWRDQYCKAIQTQDTASSIWAVLPQLLMVTVPFSLLGIWTVQYTSLNAWVSEAENTLHWIFGGFSIVLAIAIFASLKHLKAEQQIKLVGSGDKYSLAVVAFLGGMVTAWLSVGVGELVAVYLILRRFSVTMSIAVAVMLSAMSVWGGIIYYIFINPFIIVPIACFAGVGAIIGGSVAKHLVLWLNPYQVKVFFAVWVMLMGIVNLPV